MEKTNLCGICGEYNATGYNGHWYTCELCQREIRTFGLTDWLSMVDWYQRIGRKVHRPELTGNVNVPGYVLESLREVRADVERFAHKCWKCGGKFRDYESIYQTVWKGEMDREWSREENRADKRYIKLHIECL